MKAKSKFLAVLLTLAMLLSMLPIGAMAVAETALPDQPAVVTPVPDDTTTGGPATDAPAPDAPVTDAPVTDAPVTDAPATDDPSVTPAADPAADPAENGPVGPMDPGAGAKAVDTNDVAQIGETGYATFALALAKAETDGVDTTITLLKDCELASVDNGTSISQNLTITSADNKKLTLVPNASGYQYLVVGDGVTLTLNNIDIETSGNNDIFHNSGILSITGCNLTAKTPENGIFNMPAGTVTMHSGTLKADGFITSGASFSMKTGSDGVNITGGTIRLNKDAVITLLSGSTEPTTAFEIQTEHSDWTKNVAAGDVLLKGSAVADDAKLNAIAAQITVGDGKSWNVAKGSDANATNLVMHQLDTVKYVLAQHTGETSDGSLANPYKTLQDAYTAVPDNGEIRVLNNMTTETALNCSEAKAVTITSAYRYNNISLKPDYPAADEGWTVKRGETLKNQTAFTVSDGGVTLKNIVFDGGAKWGNEGLLARTNSGIANAATESNDGQLFTVNANSALTLESGAVLQNNDRTNNADNVADKGSAVYVDGGTLTMNTGASIKNNRVAASGFTGEQGDGAAVAVWGATGKFYMNGGTITGNTTRRMGGAIRLAEGNMYLSGGEISGNATTYSYTGKFGGGISVNSGTLHLSKNPVVKDNLNIADVCNISYDGEVIVIDEDLTPGANIGITGAAGPFATAAVDSDANYVHSDNRQLKVEFDSTAKKLKLVSDPNAYVSASGSDSSDGSKEHPYQTIGKAYAQVATNGTIYVMTDLAPTWTTDFATLDKAVTITSCKANGDAWASAADTHTISRSVNSLFTINKGTVTLKNITLTDKTHHVNSPVCIGNAGDANTPKLVMATGATITGTESNFAAVYMFKGNMTMETGSSITGNTNKGDATKTSPQEGLGGGVYVSADGKLSVGGNVKISGNTAGGVASNVYLASDGGTHFAVTGDLTADARIGISGVDGILDASGKFGTTTETATYVSNIIQDKADPLMAIHGTTKTELHWAGADKTWLDQVADAANGYGWNDDGSAGNTDGINGGGAANNGSPNGILIDTPAKLYSLAWAIQNNYKTGNTTGDGTKYADGYYYVNRDLDMTGFTWIPLGTTAIPFTGVFEGEGVRTITGINYSANELFGLFGAVGVAGGKVHAIPGEKGTAELAEYLKGTAIYNLAVDGSKTTGKIWNSSTTTHMGGIAAKATSATIQNCSVRNLTLTILNTPSVSVFVGGIVGETLGTTCKLLNNSVGQSGAAMTLLSDAASGNLNSHTGGIVGKASGTTISGNTVGGNNAHSVKITADPSDNSTTAVANYAGGVVGYMAGGSITNETWAHLNAMTVLATSSVSNNEAYAGGVAGFLASDAAMTGCTPGANDGEQHHITAQCYSGFTAGKNYAGGLVGGMSGTSSIASSTIGASDSQSYTVTAGVGAESVAGGLVGTMVGTTVQSLTDCTISGDSMDSVKVTANGAAGTAGGLVGTAMNARVIKCSAQNISVFGGKASGGLAGTFKATSLAADNGLSTAPGVMAMCYERNCEVTGASHCDMIQTADKALVLACYATKAAPQDAGVYAVANATGSKFVGCYTTANQAASFAVTGGDFKNCYFVGTGTTCADTDQAVGITAEIMKKADGGALTQMNAALKDAYDTVTGGLRMGYMAGQSAQINGNYNYPVYAVYLLTVNSLPSSVYGTYTVKADGKDIATNATGFNQYWVGKGAKITITGAQSAYADGAITYTMTTDEAGTTTDANVTDVAMTFDKTATVTFTPKYYPGWTINTDLTNQAIYGGVVSGELGKTDNKLTGNAVYSEESVVTPAWTSNARTIKTIFVTASTITDGASNPTISAFTADGWTVATGGVGRAYVQLTNAQGANAAEVSAIVNSFTFAANKTSTGTVSVDVQVYVDETIRGSMHFFGGSVYELAGSAVGQPAAKALAENSTLGAKKGHLVVIGSSAEHAFLKDNVKTNAWTAAESTSNNTTLTNWTWDGASATTDETSYLQNQTSWQNGEPNNSGTYATYNYGGKFDDTNGANVALIEYDGKTASAAGWQAYSALAIGTVSVYVSVPSGGGGTNPTSPTTPPKPTKPGTIKPVDPQISGVATLLNTDAHMEYLRGDQTGSFHPTSAITRAEVAQLFYNLLRDKNGEAQATFTDVKDGAWYAEAVNRLAAMGILKGKSAGIFKPNDPISRAEFTTVALRFAKGIQGKVSFEDVPESYWAHDNITGAAQYGWIRGYADGSFKPLNPITRAEAVKMVNTMLGRFPDEAFIDKSTDVKTFPDVKSDYWAFYEIVEATNAHAFSKDKDGAETWKR